MSEPSILRAPVPLDFADDSPIRGVFCYVLRDYAQEGISVLYSRSREGFSIQCGDWMGGRIDLGDPAAPLHGVASEYLRRFATPVVSLMSSINLNQAQLYLNPDMTLVDVRLSLNKFVGPGMLGDLFGKIFEVPKILKVETIDERAMSAIGAGTGSYAGDLMLKPSLFRNCEGGSGEFTPLYVRVKR